MRRIIVILAAVICCSLAVKAQTVRSQIVEGGGTGPYKAQVVKDASLERFTLYRPQDLKAAVSEVGKLPVILYANGGCANENIQMRYLLSEVCSYGYLAVAIGPYDEADFFARWRGTLQRSSNMAKTQVMANGEVVPHLTEAEKRAMEADLRRQRTQAQGGQTRQATYPRMLLEALDWLTDQNADPKSEYYHTVDLGQVAAMGQSCGGAQVLGVAHDPRIRTCVILNSGIGDMSMQGVTPAALENLHTPMLYLIGGPADVAYPNAAKDFERISGLPVVMINTLDGHEGTYYEKHGGAYAVTVHEWLDWQLKSRTGSSALFLNDEYFRMKRPEWSIVRKNY